MIGARINTQQRLVLWHKIGLLGLLIWIVYTFLHESGHALLMLFFGGKITEFSIAFWNFQAHVSCSGTFSNLENLCIQLGGILLPVVVWGFFMLLAPKGVNASLEVAKLISATTIIGTLSVWVAVPIFYMNGLLLVMDDTTLFMACSGLNGYVVSGAFLLLVIACAWLAVHRIGWGET